MPVTFPVNRAFPPPRQRKPDRPDADLKQMYSALTVVTGKVVHTGPVRYEA